MMEKHQYILNSKVFWFIFSELVVNRSYYFIFKQEAEAAWHVNQIFELVLEQCVANYYRDNTIAK